MPAEAHQSLSLTVNGEVFCVPGEHANKSLNEFIRTQTRFKVSCVAGIAFQAHRLLQPHQASPLDRPALATVGRAGRLAVYWGACRFLR